jgi:ABC-type nitrate/sulfonate/bicarbonate transport system permease component
MQAFYFLVNLLKRSESKMRFIKTLFVALVVLGLWYIASRHTNPLFLPKPEKVWQDLVELTQNGMLAKSAWISFYRITLAVSLACLVSIPIGLLTANYKVWDRLTTPFVDFLLAYGVGWTYVIIVEVINSVSGLGHIINLGTSRGRTDLVLAAVFVIIAISVVFDVVGRKIIRKTFPWKFAREISGG